MTSPKAASINAWDAQVDVAVCENCQWRCLLPGGAPAHICPNCCKKTLMVLPGGLPEMPPTPPPELVLPFALSQEALAQAVNDFCAGVPYRTEGLNPAQLRANLRRIFLPMWLVDANVSAQWQAEAGFDYEVISHQEHYDQNRSGWISKEIKERRVRWENRVGRLKRAYHNVAVPALEDALRLEKQLGPFQREQALSYQADQVREALIRLPDLTPKDAWPEAVPAFQKTGAQECQQACGADHLRQFRWKAQFTDLNWTLLLLPVYATHYLDEDGRRRPVMINGQSGQVSGERRASLRRAGMTSLILLAASAIAVVLGLLIQVLFGGSSAGGASLATILILFGFLGILGAGVPYLIAFDFNRRHSPEG